MCIRLLFEPDERSFKGSYPEMLNAYYRHLGQPLGAVLYERNGPTLNIRFGERRDLNGLRYPGGTAAIPVVITLEQNGKRNDEDGLLVPDEISKKWFLACTGKRHFPWCSGAGTA